jgi:hypothetical protein
MPGARERERPGFGVAGTGGTAVSSSIEGGDRSAGPAMRCGEVDLRRRGGAIQEGNRGYRWAFGPPGPALAWARGGPLNFVSGQPGPNSHRVVSCPPTGCGEGPSPGPSCCFVPGQPGIARP